MISIIDYDAGNIKSVEKALNALGQDAIITRDNKKILESSHVILPGVGAFGDAMDKLNSYELVPVIQEVVKKGTPFLGICLGQQLLFDGSEEAPNVKGLGLLTGQNIKFSLDMGLKVPQIGWNSLDFPSEGSLFKGVNEGSFVYFVHSYYLPDKYSDVIKATCEYGATVGASVEQDNVFGCQFHPEKSSEVGFKILQNFISIK